MRIQWTHLTTEAIKPHGTPCKSPVADKDRLLTAQKSTVRIPFASPEHAEVAKQAIEVDRELQPHAVKRTLTVEGYELIAYVTICPRFMDPKV